MTLPDAHVNKNLEGPGIRARVQRFGGHLAGMIMPNIGAFIAWGLITALFIPKGWLPNEALATLVGPMIYFLLPLLIGYTGGRVVHGQRGAVIGAIATMGVIMGGITDVATLSGTPMFLGAMIMGPLAAWLLKQLDSAIEGRVPAGFEMLIDNFSLGILGMIMAILGLLGVAPVVDVLVGILTGGTNFLIGNHLLPLVSIFVEPAKVLFLNNAINHGIFGPLGLAQAAETGKSILFTVESNPGAGLGLLVAFFLAGPKTLRPSTPGAMVIHFLGGIHEIYFPYVLMRPITLLGMIAGSASGLAIGSLMGSGLVSTPAPGSIFAYALVTPPDGHLAVLTQVLTAAVVSFVVNVALLRLGGKAEEPDAAGAAPASTAPLGMTSSGEAIVGSDIRKVIIACDAGMGSSVMVSSNMKKRLAPYGIEVSHTPVDRIPGDAQLVLTQEGLAERARKTAPHAVIVPFANYMGDPAFDRVEAAIRDGLPVGGSAGEGVTEAPAAVFAAQAASAPGVAPTTPRRRKALASGILARENIRLGQRAADKEDAIRQAGEVLVAAGAAEPAYIDGMLARELQVSTFLGEGVAIPHGTNEARAHITATALGFLQFPDGVDWNGKTAYVVIPIASNSDEHVGILSALATTLADRENSARLRTASSAEEVLDLLTPDEE